ncbi:MAG: Prolipoprotein diacylglyceryl transferase [Parcubacteria group bacterium ADurb.Bin316]|nr:MAG: Prolipoprotein diacylglyceryl transferase [Parcubacteria group bacterium ADurb.Bin316]
MYWFNNPPSAIIFNIGPINFYWYGLIMILAIASGYCLTWSLAKKHNWKSNDLVDLAFNIIIGGLIGARLYHVIIHWYDYSHSLIDILKIWEGGLAIHGALIGGGLALLLTSHKRHWPLWQIASWITPGLALGQAIGRWGNFFNQELFGPPTNRPWGIPIDVIYRPINTLISTHYTPLFLYESLACALLAILLYYFNRRAVRPQSIIGTYFIGYGLIRLTIEFWRQDPTLYLLNWRWPQWISCLMIFGGLWLIIYPLILRQKH